MSNGAGLAVESVEVERPPITPVLPRVARRGAPKHVPPIVASFAAVAASAAAARPVSPAASAASELPPPDASAGPVPLEAPLEELLEEPPEELLDEPLEPASAPASLSSPDRADDPHAGTTAIPAPSATSAPGQPQTRLCIQHLSAPGQGW
jgi:hypothetical protein